MLNRDLKRVIAGVTMATLIVIAIFVMLALVLTTRYDIVTQPAYARGDATPTPFYSANPLPSPRVIKHNGVVKSGTVYVEYVTTYTTWGQYGFTLEKGADTDTPYSWNSISQAFTAGTPTADNEWNNSGAFSPTAPPSNPASVNLTASWTDGNNNPNPGTQSGWGGSSDDGTLEPTTGTVTVVLYRTTLKSLEFTSDHQAMYNNNSDWSSYGSPMPEPEWNTDPTTNVSISQTKNTPLTVKVTVKVEPSGIPFVLFGTCSENCMNFTSTGQTSTGSNQDITISSNTSLPNHVCTLNDKSISWKIKFTVPDPDLDVKSGDSGPHKIYVTYGTPTNSSVTEKRVAWVCQYADGATTQGACADKLHDAVASQTTFSASGTTTGWALLGGGTGDCDNQALCMFYAVYMLGAGGASHPNVHASSDAGVGNCLSLEGRPENSPTEYLILDYNTGAGNNWNAHEGCCACADRFFAITPKKSADNDYEMLMAISCQQFWVRTNKLPGLEGWYVEQIFEEVGKP